MSEPSDASSVDEVIAEYLQLAEQGRDPKRQDFLDRYPQFQQDLKDFFRLHDEFAQPESVHLAANSTAKDGQAAKSIRKQSKATSESSIASNPPQFLGDYEILGEIDRGGMGVVYRARHQRLNRIVALKLIRSGSLASDEEVERFLSEAEAAAALSHPNIVPIYEVGQINGLVFYTMAYIEGDSLAQLVAKGMMESDEAVRILHRLCNAVEYAHRAGIYHRDLKPANVLINEEGQPVIIDFGLAKVANRDQSLTATGQILGTPAYMTPELASGRVKTIGPAADVYALGAILYFLCTGQPAFSGPTPFDVLLQVLDKRPPRPSKLKKHLSRDIDTICLKALEKEPSARYQTATELGSDLQRVLTGEPIDSPQESWTEKLTKWWQREPILVAHVMGIGITTLIVVVAYLIREEYNQLFYYRLGLLLIWLAASFFLQTWVDLAKWNHAAIFTWLAIDVFLYTTLITFAGPPRSMLLIGYPMMIVGSGLFYQRRFTVTKTVLCIVGFSVLAWQFPKDDFVKPDFSAIFLTGLIVICLCTITMINRIRGLSRFYED
ncbi:MAG: serine/threonine-protein kinase [Planctomycetota bacterium]